MQARFGHPILTTGQRNGHFFRKLLVTALKRIMMVKDTTPSWCVMLKNAIRRVFKWAVSGRESAACRIASRHNHYLSEYSDSCIANRSSTQPTNSNRLNTQCSTLLATALIWRDSWLGTTLINELARPQSSPKPEPGGWLGSWR